MEAHRKPSAGDRYMLWGMFLFVLVMIDVLEPKGELYARAVLASAGVLAMIGAALRTRMAWETRAAGYARGASAIMLALGYGSPTDRWGLPSTALQVAAIAVGFGGFLLAVGFEIHRKLAQP
jgi:hypothetical protein